MGRKNLVTMLGMNVWGLSLARVGSLSMTESLLNRMCLSPTTLSSSLRKSFGTAVLTNVRSLSSKKWVVPVGEGTIIFTADAMAKQAQGSIFVQEGATQLLATTSTTPNNSQRLPGLLGGGAFANNFKLHYKEHASSMNERQNNFATQRETFAIGILESIFVPRVYADTISQLSLRLMSADGVADPIVLAINSASASLMHSGCDWAGPVAAVRVGMAKNGSLLVNPRPSVLQALEFHILYVADRNGAVYVSYEGTPSKEREFDAFFGALETASLHTKDILDTISAIPSKQAIPNPVIPTVDETLMEVTQKHAVDVVSIMFDDDKANQQEIMFNEVSSRVPLVQKLFPLQHPSHLKAVFNAVIGHEIVKRIVDLRTRADGREFDALREVFVAHSPLSVPDGSALVSIGHSESISRAAVETNSFYQRQQTLDHPSSNLDLVLEVPPFSASFLDTHIRSSFLSEEASFVKSSLAACVPHKKFAAPISLNCEITTNDGSEVATSLLSAYFALKSSGFGLKSSIGCCTVGCFLKTQSDSDDDDCNSDSSGGVVEKTAFLTDLSFIEDSCANIRFAAASTNGTIITLNMTSRVGGVPHHIIATGVEKLQNGCRKMEHIVQEIALSAPESNKAKAFTKLVQVDKDKIGMVIGKGGASMKIIEGTSGARVHVDGNDGIIRVVADSEEKLEVAEELIKKAVDRRRLVNASDKKKNNADSNNTKPRHKRPQWT
eukprot:m.65058 g.65058  ORF g.65058 m.65058 type:complete len:723 (-) comp8140_c0_seq1:1327-3495(-)